MKLSLASLLVLLTIFSLNFNVMGENNVPKEKNTKVLYLMDSRKDSLVVSNVEQEKNGVKNDLTQIFFNDTDYTYLVRNLLKSKPLAYASSRFLIFSNEKVELKSDVWKCKEGTVFVPEESGVIYIKATNIEWHECDHFLNGKTAKLRKVDLKGNQKKEEHLSEFSLNLQTYHVANTMIHDSESKSVLGKIRSIYYMDGDKNHLSIVDKSAGSAQEDMELVFFNGIDYTKFVKDLFVRNTLAFASGEILIFSGETVKFTSGKWYCPNGIIFIPRESEVMLVESNNIVYDDDKQVLEGNDSKVRIMDMGGKLKKEETLINFTIELNVIK